MHALLVLLDADTKACGTFIKCCWYKTGSTCTGYPTYLCTSLCEVQHHARVCPLTVAVLWIPAAILHIILQLVPVRVFVIHSKQRAGVGRVALSRCTRDEAFLLDIRLL